MFRPLILVTNDDGMFAPGIRALVGVVKEMGEVVVVAPNTPQSGQGHAITIEHPIRLHRVNVFDSIVSYECSGTPVDCVKLAKNVLLKDRKIDLCVSGINHGSNASINIIYSGTMSAAMEASIEGINSIGFSLCDYSFDADFSPAQHFVRKLVSNALESSENKGGLLNVNFPKLPLEEIKGIKVCRQGNGTWQEDFQEAKDPRSQTYYWLTGEFIHEENNTDTDLWALANGYVSVVPSKHDLTDHEAISGLDYLEDL